MLVARKERTDHKCLWQRKKDQTTDAGGKQKMAALIKQANSWHQMKKKKTAEATSKTQTVAYLRA